MHTPAPSGPDARELVRLLDRRRVQAAHLLALAHDAVDAARAAGAPPAALRALDERFALVTGMWPPAPAGHGPTAPADASAVSNAEPPAVPNVEVVALDAHTHELRVGRALARGLPAPRSLGVVQALYAGGTLAAVLTPAGVTVRPGLYRPAEANGAGGTWTAPPALARHLRRFTAGLPVAVADPAAALERVLAPAAAAALLPLLTPD